MTLITSYLEYGVKRTLFYCSLDVVRLDYWVDSGPIKGKLISYHYYFHSVSLFLMGLGVSDDATLCELGVLGDFIPVD